MGLTKLIHETITQLTNTEENNSEFDLRIFNRIQAIAYKIAEDDSKKKPARDYWFIAQKQLSIVVRDNLDIKINETEMQEEYHPFASECKGLVGGLSEEHIDSCLVTYLKNIILSKSL